MTRLFILVSVLMQELSVVEESLVHVYPFGTTGDKFVAHIQFVPTVPHCSLATLIGQSHFVLLSLG